MGNKTVHLDRSREGVIKAFFNYDADTGKITWKDWVSPEWYRSELGYEEFFEIRAGNIVDFGKTRGGYPRITAGGLRGIYAHHIAWVLFYGVMPENHIDHVDGNPKNNRIQNLRDVPHNINHRNRKMSNTNSSGVTGVYWSKKSKKWQAQIKVDGDLKYLGCYNKIEEAAKARQAFIDENEHLGFTERHGHK